MNWALYFFRNENTLFNEGGDLMTFRQESDEYEVWYSDESDPDSALQYIVVNKMMPIRELSWWLSNIQDQYSHGIKIDFIREHFK